MGGLAGDGTDDGANNVAVGYLALSGNCGDGNVAVGESALEVATGSNNVMVGKKAGEAVSSGNNNTLIGNVTGNSSHTASLTTGSDNVIVGHDVDTSGADSVNQIALGTGFACTGNNNFCFGKLSNVVENDFDTDANWSRSSDERLKKNIVDQKLGLDFINDLRTVKYNWKSNGELDATDSQLAHLRKEDEDGNIINYMNTTATMHNFIAQEVKAALDKAGVSDFGGWKKDQYGVQQVSREMFVIPLVKAVQELSAKNDALEARIKKLEDG